MKLSDLSNQSGEWLAGTGPQHEIVVSSRVRLARNLATFPFLSKANRLQRSELHKVCRERLLRLSDARPSFYVDMERTDEIDRQLLVERHLISKQHAAGEGSRGVSISNDEAVSVMVNEEDHLRLQVLRSGLQLKEAWGEADKLDDAMQEHLEFAFSQRFGFLTACPTNLGTGLRISVMLHLPALKLTGEIEKVFRAAKELHLAVRGLYGEGTEAIGDFYQISNQTTLGRTEDEILREFNEQIIPKIITAELAARQILESERPLALDDKIGRAIGVLKHARMLSSEETLFFLSHLRLGVVMKRVTGLDLAAINSLFLNTQPAHLQRGVGKPLDGDARKAARAEYVRTLGEKQSLVKQDQALAFVDAAAAFAEVSLNPQSAATIVVYMHLTPELIFRAAPHCASIDGEIANWFRAHLTPVFADILLALSGPGGALWIASAIAISVAFLAWTKRWYMLGWFCASVPCGALLAEGLKLVVQRQRPFVSGPLGEWGGYSFPSGHTTAATVLYVFLAMALVPLFKRRRWRLMAISTATLLIMCVAFSRVALGAHYLTDVVGAMGLGTSWVVLCSAGAQRLRARRLAQPDSLADSPIAVIAPAEEEPSELAA